MTGRDHLLDLLASRATEGLDVEQTDELQRLIAEQDELGLDDFDEAAAVADLAFHSGPEQLVLLEPMPHDLKQRILADALVRMPAPVPEAARFVKDDSKRGASSGRSPFASPYLGWYAAAAILILALWSPWSRLSESASPVAPSPAQQRAALIAEEGDVIRVEWSPPEIEGYTGVRGDVVWSNRRQTGFMRLVGLPANVPGDAQYQLWIVDPTRDTHPIDGGVFDVAAGAGEVIVPIDAKLEVDQAAAFAITLEKPGGVVVSDGPLLVVASVT